MTAAENVAFGLEMRGIELGERLRRVRETLDLVGLGGFADRYPQRLSGGQQQRVALARALAIRPRILLLDEPLSNLDAKLREEMQIELRHIQRTLGTTTILVTHDQIEAMALSDRIAVMNAGRVEQIGTPADVYEKPATAFVASFLGRTNVVGVDVRREGADVFVFLGDGRWPARTPVAPGKATATIRPEKICFAPVIDGAGLSGKIRTRVFQGSHWLYEVATPGGEMTVIRQNTAEASPDEGAAVRLTWRPEDMSIGPAA
jgi:putative spermidine/putrescine transport system ATP-binding protein